MIEESPRATFLSRAANVLRVAAFSLAVCSILATFLLLTGFLNAVLTAQSVTILVIGTSAVAAILFLVVVFDLFQLYRQWRQGLAGTRTGGLF